MCTVFIFVSREEKGFHRIGSFTDTKMIADRTAGSAAVCKDVIDHALKCEKTITWIPTPRHVEKLSFHSLNI